jgi:hypothetical protein
VLWGGVKKKRTPHFIWRIWEWWVVCPFAEPVSDDKSLGLSHRCFSCCYFWNPPSPRHQLSITFITLSCLENYRLGLPYWSSIRRKTTSSKLVGFFLTSPFRSLSFLGYFISSVLDLLVLSFLASPVTLPVSAPRCLHSMCSNSPHRMWSLTFWSSRIKFKLHILCESP